MTHRLDEPALDRLFRTARTRNGWSGEEISEALIREIYDTAKWGPTAANTNPARFLFLKSLEARTRLGDLASATNRVKILAAPVCVIVGYDLDFAEKMPELFPHNPGAKHWFADPEAARVTAVRNGTLQGAYLMIAARALGLDCGPMSGFDNAGVDAAFFAGTKIQSNFICNIGHGTEEGLFERNPRLTFEGACQIL
ncbi:malonic semialdehyde reductase [Phenylobacterium aquaticum]|uniref:malonic semialdehyde reductase n=1 Tax=Phenylobacterium aquaticum TaxID=1763816 RepID=UPI0026EAD3CB|nr:malonic semialdehyde reductase [Phenylobacterium aquaticum]